MLHSKTRWVLQEQDENIINEFTEQLKITPLVAKLLLNRGIETVEDARSFLHIEEATFHDPFLFEGMSKAVARIKQAIDENEQILIYGDYDADGVTSTTIMMTVLNDLGANVQFYIPNRFTEGYGPNEHAFRHAADSGVQLIITVDTGVSAVKEAQLAKELGMDLIITDHHEAGETLPDAFAIIHPKLPGTTYPFDALAGVGVAFKVAHALYGKVPTHVLDLAVIGTVADMVPLHGENRLIAKLGLEELQRGKRPGFVQLCEIAGSKINEANESTIGFTIAPRINAVGRLGDADPAVELLLTSDVYEAEQIAIEIDELNKERQQIVNTIFEEAIEMVEKDFPPDEHHVLVIGKEGWNAGVVGIVASRILEKFNRPTIVFSYDYEKGIAKGSARSIEGFDLFENLSAQSHILPHFGGHTLAAGMTLSIDDVDELRTALNHACEQQLDQADFVKITKLDAVVTLDEVSTQTIEELNLLAPYGMDNPQPTVVIEQVDIKEIRKIGANKTHMKILVSDGESQLDGIGFSMGEKVDEISADAKVSLVGELEINEWNNIRKPQIRLKDLAVKEWQLFDYRNKKSIDELIEKDEPTIIVFQREHLSMVPTASKVIHIDEWTDEMADSVKQTPIVLFDLPQETSHLDQLLKHISPSRIYVYFYHDQSQFFTTMPTRDHFKWYYAFLFKRRSFHLQQYGAELAHHKGWSSETIDFMSKVFLELEFVTIENGVIFINQAAQKRDLSEASLYSKKLEQVKIEQEFLYSSYKQLKQWFNERLPSDVNLEEEKVWI